MNDLELINQESIDLIKGRVEQWEQKVGNFLNEFEEYANYYRLIEAPRKSKGDGYTRTRVGETIRATEALATSIFRMLTAHEPNFELVNLNGAQNQEQMHASGILMRWQDYNIKYKRSLLRAIRSGCLMGTQIVEHPYTMRSWDGQIIYESLDFVPRSLIQCAFDPGVIFIEKSPWFAFFDYFTEDQLLDKAEQDPEHWDPIAIQKAIDQYKGQGGKNKAIDSRKTRAGYQTTDNVYEVCTYMGRIRGNKREDGRLWHVRLVNLDFPVAAFGNPHPLNEMPVSVASYIDFELEPYGYGVGRLGKKSQLHLDANRERYMDVITMSLFNMWIKHRLSGITNSSLKIRPLGIIDTDDMDGLRPHLPNLNAAQFGMKLEEMLKAEHQGVTGAVPGLQAISTDSSATEAAITQNEGMRRVAVTAEMMGEPFVRDFQKMKHQYNTEYLESDIWLAVSGMEAPVRVNRRRIARDIEVFARVTTDKDFRPKRVETIKEMFATLTSIRNVIPDQVDIIPILKELLLAVDINPQDVIKQMGSLQATSVQDMLKKGMDQAQARAQEFGDQPTSDIGADEVADTAIASTPAGPVRMSP
jgi:hypothetical protein